MLFLCLLFLFLVVLEKDVHARTETQKTRVTGVLLHEHRNSLFTKEIPSQKIAESLDVLRPLRTNLAIVHQFLSKGLRWGKADAVEIGCVLAGVLIHVLVAEVLQAWDGMHLAPEELFFAEKLFPRLIHALAFPKRGEVPTCRVVQVGYNHHLQACGRENTSQGRIDAVVFEIDEVSDIRAAEVRANRLHEPRIKRLDLVYVYIFFEYLRAFRLGFL
mmetsp:Transcript_30720/g.60133  ORF Transcript_30720/g.60133 Transcript_30720/m.60133 type:complete len:217 (-) Transcript_30720:8-658(-)